LGLRARKNEVSGALAAAQRRGTRRRIKGGKGKAVQRRRRTLREDGRKRIGVRGESTQKKKGKEKKRPDLDSVGGGTLQRMRPQHGGEKRKHRGHMGIRTKRQQGGKEEKFGKEIGRLLAHRRNSWRRPTQSRPQEVFYLPRGELIRKNHRKGRWEGGRRRPSDNSWAIKKKKSLPAPAGGEKSKK